jgi:MoxR-like ATPase
MMNFKETIQFIDTLIQAKVGLVPCLLGHTGIGKTELVEQYARSRNMDCIVIHVAQLSALF